MARTDPEPPAAGATIPSTTLVVDPGAYTIKAGLVSWQDQEAKPECHTIPNCMARSRTKHTYIGSSLAQCNDFGEMQFKRPVERGYIINWDLERAIFEHEFFDAEAPLYCDPSNTSLLLTEPPNGPTALSTNADQIIFEEFSFASAARILSPSLAALTPLPPDLSPSPSATPSEILLLIDSSHSSTTITPLLRSRPINDAVRRISIGGKHITNYLAELVSLRHFSLIDEPHIVTQMKEEACFVSTDFASDLERTWRGPRGERRPVDESIVVDYVLPDYDKVHTGYVRRRNDPSPPSDASATKPPDQEREESFPLANERFTPPELLFNPLDIGIRESGVPETVMQSLAAVPRKLWSGLLSNVLVVGGNALLPGFVERLGAELRALAPGDCEVRVARAEDPVGATWRGGARLAKEREALGRCLVSREEYLERGEGWVCRKFAQNQVVVEWGKDAGGGEDRILVGDMGH